LLDEVSSPKVLERMTTLSEQEFRVKSDVALEQARDALLPLADEHEFEVELQNGVLNLVFEEPHDTKFVVSPNAPVRQVWVSAMSRSFKLAWDADLEGFALGGEALPDLLKRLTSEFLVS
jgi:CyaY protein